MSQCVQKTLELLQEVRNLPGIFGDSNWQWAQWLRKQFLDPGIQAARLLLKGGPYSKKDINSLTNMIKMNTKAKLEKELLQFLIESQLLSSLNQLSASLAIGNDYSLKRTAWKTKGDHDF